MPRKKPGEPLTDKERAFCHEYISDLNSTNAAIRAGYSEDSAASTASHLLADPDVRAFIARLQEDKFYRLSVTADHVLQELSSIAFTEFDDYYMDAEEGHAEVENASTDEVSELPDTEPTTKRPPALCYKRVITDPKTGDKTTLQFNLYHKIMALRTLAKHLGLFEKNKYKREANIIITPTGKRDNITPVAG